jgi:ABC-type sugar transport system ATPase subunit
VIVASDDLEELAAICSRVMVMQRGRIVQELRRPDLDADRLTRAVFAGVEPES